MKKSLSFLSASRAKNCASRDYLILVVGSLLDNEIVRFRRLRFWPGFIWTKCMVSPGIERFGSRFDGWKYSLVNA